ncbi:universal stress protein [Desulfoglaeba alkanexedens]|uniref:Universal stress protein n=1 Tax=Desulfoglaeba alkanexedens ALDC TaxID=980445 RepID=A0A4P8L268_9BACT|nr:universal stress protein [Desulfoglaeba alkanexedens]QCQ21733.1 universal stress protein [Desulfoglaeba alkanexedens ALDC]
MLKKIKGLVTGKRRPDGRQVDITKAGNIKESFEIHMEAATYAEGGMHEAARQVMNAVDSARRKVLVVGHEDRFSKAVMDYALGFAERMGYEIVALNVLPLPKESPRVAPYCSLISREFTSSCEECAVAFRRECERRGIPFVHEVRMGRVEDCIREVHNETRGIEFVISEPDVPPEVVQDGERWVIPVYSLAH